MDFTEELLHYFWKAGLYKRQKLYCTNGESLEIIDSGLSNPHSGPDFENCLVRLGNTRWAGNVEMHIHSSDWYKHQHQHDLAYDTVILHVVYQHDEPVFRTDGTEIPVLELKNLIPANLISTYRDLIRSKNWIPCSNHLADLDSIYINAWLERVLLERLHSKSDEVIQLVEEQKGSWDDAFYIHLARNFGFKVNEFGFESMARSLPQQLFARHKNNHQQVEALIFGQAGFLKTTFRDEYPQKLKAEYDFLKKKYNLSPLKAEIWKFMRLRPANFPTIRLAQFAALVCKSNHLFTNIIELQDEQSLKALFTDLPIYNYWDNHFRFDKLSEKQTKQPGKQSVSNLLMNTVCIFLFAYGRYNKQEIYRIRALKLLETLNAEHNSVIRNFKQLGIKVNSAAISQALLQLKKKYCDAKHCLKCGIGAKILSRT